MEKADSGMITASVVLYNTPKSQVDSLLASVAESRCVGRLWAVDNSPDDRRRTLERQFPFVRYIHNANLGYGASHNIALREAIEEGATYHAVLNPDIRFGGEVLPALAAFMDGNPDASCAMPEVVSPGGECQHLCKLLPSPGDLILRRFVPSVMFLRRWKEKRDARYCLIDSGYGEVMDVPCLSGCFMFLRLETLARHGIFFDERFFMYMEDVDLCRRLHAVSRTLYFPHVRIVHDHARESYRSRRMLAAHLRSAAQYFCKWGWLFDRGRRETNAITLRGILDAAGGQV